MLILTGCGYEPQKVATPMDDRLVVDLKFGAPDKIDAFPNGPQKRPIEEGGFADGYSYEIWHYDYLPQLGHDQEFEFVDDCLCGWYELTSDGDTVLAARSENQR